MKHSIDVSTMIIGVCEPFVNPAENFSPVWLMQIFTCIFTKKMWPIVRKWFEERFKVLPCPPNSPDLNPFEHQWDVLEQEAQSMAASALNL